VSYNYSTQSATPEDFIAMTRHILTKFKPKMILISFDFEVLNKNTKTDDMFFSSPLKNYLSELPPDQLKTDLFNNSYLTLESIADSLNVIWVNLFGKAQHTYLEDGDHIIEPLPKTLELRQFSYPDYTFDEKRIEYLKTIKMLADKNSFEVVAFTSPLSYEHVEKINSDPKLKAIHEKFKLILAQIFGKVHDFQNEGNKPYNSLQYFRDSNHPTHEFSTMVLERIFGKESPDNPAFGKIITQ
jgi:hypothetical protein